MASRKKGQGDPLSAIVMLIAAALPAAFAALYVAFQYTFSFVVFAFPLVAIACLVPTLKASINPPAIPDPEPYVAPSIMSVVADAVATANAWSAHIDGLYQQGEDEGLRLTSKSEHTRFDVRSGRGDELNRAIDDAEHEIEVLNAAVTAMKKSQRSTLPDWQSEIAEWKRKSSLRVAVIWSVVASLAVYALTSPKSFGLGDAALANAFALFERWMAWRPIEIVGTGPYALAVLTGYAVLPAAYVVSKLVGGPPIDVHLAQRWAFVYAAWSPRTKADLYFVGGNPSAFAEKHQFQDHEPDVRSSDWPLVLGVDRDAEVSAIKSAYRTKIKQYHADRMSGMGAELIALAEEKSKIINAAYEYAQSDRGFN